MTLKCFILQDNLNNVKFPNEDIGLVNINRNNINFDDDDDFVDDELDTVTFTYLIALCKQRNTCKKYHQRLHVNSIASIKMVGLVYALR